MARLTVVLMSAETINLGVWLRALHDAGFEMTFDPTMPIYDDPRAIPVDIGERSTYFNFELAPASEAADWCPGGLIQFRDAKQVALFEWMESDAYAHAAALAAAAALAKAYLGAIFDPLVLDGYWAEMSGEAFRRARERFARLPPK